MGFSVGPHKEYLLLYEHLFGACWISWKSNPLALETTSSIIIVDNHIYFMHCGKAIP